MQTKTLKQVARNRIIEFFDEKEQNKTVRTAEIKKYVLSKEPLITHGVFTFALNELVKKGKVTKIMRGFYE